MASRTLAIAQGNTAIALGLTGMPVEVLEDIKDVEQRLSDLIENQNVEVVVLDEAYRGEFSEWFNMRLSRHSGTPLLIFCPAFDEEDAGTDAYINSIVKPAVGFEIRLD